MWLKLLDPVLGLALHVRGVPRNRSLVVTLGPWHTAVERIDQLMQVGQHLLSLGFGCRRMGRVGWVIGAHGVLPARGLG
jgi:hypothetical protein